MLAFIWMLSLVLSLTSIVAMVALVLRRAVIERQHGDDKALRQKLQLALIRFTQDGDRTALDAGIAHLPRHVMVEAGFELLSLLRGEERRAIERVFAEIGLPDHVRRQLARAHEADRIFACEVLEAFAEPPTIVALVAALNDRSGDVRVAAGISLTRMGALPPLDAVLAKIGPRGQRSRRLIELFQNFPADRASELSDYALDEAGAPLVRAAAIDALSATGEYSLLPVFDRCARDPVPEIAAAAVRALGRIAHPASALTISTALSSPEWQIRAEAAEAVGRIGAGATIEQLTGLIEDGEWSVRFEAGKSLRGLGAAGLAALTTIAAGVPSRGQRTASLVLAEAPG